MEAVSLGFSFEKTLPRHELAEQKTQMQNLVSIAKKGHLDSLSVLKFTCQRGPRRQQILESMFDLGVQVGSP